MAFFKFMLFSQKKRSLFLIAVFVLIALFFFFWFTPKKVAPPGFKKALININQTALFKEEFCLRLRLLDPSQKDHQKWLKTAKNKVLKEMTEEALLLDHWLTQNPKADFEKKMAEFEKEIQKNINPSLSSLDKTKSIHFSKNEIAEIKRFRARKNFLIEYGLAEIEKKIDISSKKLKQHYQKNKANYQRPQGRHVRHIMTNTKKKAAWVRNEILKGSPFSEMALFHSVAADKKKGGDMGIVYLKDLPQPIGGVIFDLKPKEISEVVESPYGFHLFFLIDVVQPKNLSFNQVKDQIYRELFEEQIQKSYQAWLNQLKNKAQIDIAFEQLESNCHEKSAVD